MEQNNEQDWVQRAKQGEPAAIAELFRLYWRAARAAAFGVTGDFALAEDAASEAFYAAIESLPDLKDTRRFGPWLRTIVIRTARRQKARTSMENGAELQIQPDGKSPPPGADLERQELVALIHEAVGHLSENLREAVVLFYFEGYSLKEAAGFLDIPEGTLKRRLHDGRKRLRDAAGQILKGAKPMNTKRQQILKQLKEAFEEGPETETFYQAMREAMRLRPFPNEMLREAMRKHWAPKFEKAASDPERTREMRKCLSLAYSASERAADPNHPVGAVAGAIRAALPDFKSWQPDVSKINYSQAARQMFEGKASFSMPSRFAEESSASYISAMRTWLVQDSDGSVCTTSELIQKKATQKEMHEQMSQGNRLSDALRLFWKRPEPIELRVVEDMLRHLSETIVPGTPVRFTAFDGAQYRAGLRMQLTDIPIPAALGGVHNPHPLLGTPDGTGVASVMIYLEPWAAAKSGEVVELTDFSLFDFMKKKEQ
jgi:RNA polymerase sigma factor (sigma-70 family)